jgi:hypothetical protein
MKNLKSTVGITSSLIIFIGCLFKTLHFPGTGAILLAGGTMFVLAFIPLLIVSILRNEKYSGLTKFTYSFGYLSSAAFITSIIFKFLQLQYTTFLMRWSLTALTFMVMPLFFYSVYVNTNKGEERSRKLTQATIIMAVVGLLYTLVDLRAM